MPPIERTLSQIDGKPHQRRPSSARPSIVGCSISTSCASSVGTSWTLNLPSAVWTISGRMSNIPCLAGFQPCAFARSVMCDRVRVADDRPVRLAMPGVGDQLAVPHLRGGLAGADRREDRDRRLDAALVEDELAVVEAALGDALGVRDVAEVAHCQAAPVELADAARVVTPREPGTDRQLLLRVHVGAGLGDLLDHVPHAQAPFGVRERGVLLIELEELPNLLGVRCALDVEIGEGGSGGAGGGSEVRDPVHRASGDRGGLGLNGRREVRGHRPVFGPGQATFRSPGRTLSNRVRTWRPRTSCPGSTGA